MSARIERVVTSGIFSLDGEDHQVENNVWLVGDSNEVIVIDAAHSAAVIAAAIGERRVAGIICTHGHNDHINAAVELSSIVNAPIALHPKDRMLWDMVYDDRSPDLTLDEHERIGIGGTELVVLETPGHSPGGICLYGAELSAVFSGDTLFSGGPGATGRSFSDYDTIVESIRGKLFTLGAQTVVHTGHGDSTTIGAEAAALT